MAADSGRRPEVLRAGVAPPVPFELGLSSEAVGRDRATAAALLAPVVADQAAAEEAAAALAADRDAARRRADAAVAELVTAREEAVDLRGDLSRRAIDTAFQMGLRQVAEHRAGLLDRQLSSCRLELDGLRRTFQAEQTHQAALLVELGGLRDQCREAQLTIVRHRERQQSREVGAPVQRQLPVVDSPPVGPAAGPAGRLPVGGMPLAAPAQVARLLMEAVYGGSVEEDVLLRAAQLLETRVDALLVCIR